MSGILPYDYPFVKTDLRAARGWKEVVAILRRLLDEESVGMG